MLKKLIAGGAVVAAVLVYIFFANNNSSSQAIADSAGSSGNNPFPSGNSSGSESINPDAGGSSGSTDASSGSTSGSSSGGTSGDDTSSGSTGSTGGTTAGEYKDGTYKGPVTDAVYGPLQAEAIISGGKLTNVKLLQYPNDPGHTTDVSNMSLPQLVEEAISAQSAQVDIISGATQTSEAFQQSLGAALQSAQA